MRCLSAIHVFDAPGAGLTRLGAASTDSVDTDDLARFLAREGCERAGIHVRANEGAVAEIIVVGPRGKSGLAKLFLGRVAHEILRIASIDVLAVPPAG